MNAAPVIRTLGLSKTFEEVEALKDLNLSVPANSIFGFLGPNGAGKTTTMKLLLGLDNGPGPGRYPGAAARHRKTL